MKALMDLGAALIVVGIIALSYQSISYTTREKIIDRGPVQATAEKEKTVALPPLLGALSLGAGVLLGVVGAIKSKR